MTAGLRLIAGKGLADRGAHLQLVIRLFDHARAQGIERLSIETSRCGDSKSRYLIFADRKGRTWRIRVSNHHRPSRAQVPHLDLISCDGVAGYDQAAGFIDRAIAGEIQWFDSDATFRAIPAKQRRRIWRHR